MLNPNPIEALRRRLLELGCPVRAARKIVREAGEHWEDLQKAALGQGLTGEAAAEQAARLLGDPVVLAQQHMAALRKASWFGRHPVLGFAVVPFLMTPLVLVGSLVLGSALGFALIHEPFLTPPFDSQKILVNQPTLFLLVFGGLWTGMAVMTYSIARKIQQTVPSARWLLLAGSIISLCALILNVQIGVANGPNYTFLSVAYITWPDGMSFACALIPWAVVGEMYFRQQRLGREQILAAGVTREG